MTLKIVLISGLFLGSLSSLALAGGGHGEINMGGHQNMSGHNDKEKSPVGKPALGMVITKTIIVTTLDSMRYQFSESPQLQAGDVVKFVVTNTGMLTHEFSIGDAEEQKNHGAMMRSMPNMVHQDGNTVTVKPGETKELVWQFNSDVEVVFACNLPGHFEAGMFAKEKVAAVTLSETKKHAH